MCCSYSRWELPCPSTGCFAPWGGGGGRALLRDLLPSHGPAIPPLLSRQLAVAAIFSLTSELFKHPGLLHSRCSVESSNGSAWGTWDTFLGWSTAGICVSVRLPATWHSQSRVLLRARKACKWLQPLGTGWSSCLYFCRCCSPRKDENGRGPCCC